MTDGNNPNEFAGARVLITGGLGFIGSNLAAKLVELGAEVTLIDTLVPEYGGNRFNIDPIRDRVTVNISDVRDTDSMRSIIADQQYLFNLAGQTSHMDSMEDPYTDLAINCGAQLSILEACRNYNPEIKVVFASTRQIYGKPAYLPVDEQHLVQPVDVNGINKAAGEWYHILYNNVYGVRSCALRLTNTYGPRMRVKDARQTFVGIWVKLLLQGQPIEVWGGDQLRDFNYVDDVVDALLTCARNDAAWGNVFNLGDSEIIDLKSLAELMIDVHGGGDYRVHEFPEERKKIDIGDYYSDWQKIHQALGWQPQTSLAAGMAHTFEHYRAHLDHYL
ncbi:MAG: NAD-dependent epimerase/dehydratase family protein [Halieaceae bacterium]|jgi:UDP-glucose 4-epimerase|nr:NAD-dependent epimerase/dehydratase family protein [Halieaceae bacterium]